MPDQKTVEKMTGYKATDANMCCRGFQFELGKWYEHDGEVVICESGFHFCEYPSGPWAYYSAEGTRIFKVEAEGVVLGGDPGADLKHAAKRIRLVEELSFGGNRNTGYQNTGNWNTGDWNTGDGNTGDGNTGDWNTGNWNTGDGNTGNRNTGYQNTGNWNTGDCNTGNWNTGDCNTGDGNTGDWNTGDGNTGDGNTGNRNTGDWNTGNWNTGDCNTGDWNTGDGNTGDWNTGNRNTGDGNTGNRNTGDGNVGEYHSGDLCMGEAPYLLFGLPADRDTAPRSLIRHLSELLMCDDPIDQTQFLSIPNATPERIKALHEAHIEARKNLKGQR